MNTILSFIYTLFIILLIYRYSKKKAIFGYSRAEYNINSSWIKLLFFTLAYIIPIGDYSIAMSLIYGILFIPEIQRSGGISINKTKIILYVYFFSWCCFSILWSSMSYYSFMMLIKLAIPFIFFSYASKAFTNRKNIIVFSEIVAKSAIWYFVLNILARLCGDLIPLCNPYYGIYCFIFAIFLYLIKKDKKYLVYMILCFSYNIYYVKKTPLLAIFLALLLLYIYKYKIKSLLPVGILTIVFIAIVLFVPQVRDRMFFEGFDISQITYMDAEDILSVLNTSGRSSMWEIVIDKFYKGNEWFGVGIGTMKFWLRTSSETSEAFLLLHNDWLHILCETGRIGIYLLILFFVSLIVKCYKDYQKHQKKSEKAVAYSFAASCIMAIVHMLFENCIGFYSYNMPFIFAGMFYMYMKSQSMVLCETKKIIEI